MMKKRIAGYFVPLVLILSALACSTATPVPTVEPPVDTPTAGPGAIFGVLWHDICKFTGGEGGEPVVLGKGCVQYGPGAGEFGPNQMFDDYEEGWVGVTLHLGGGACPSASIATSVTDADGNYRFDGLAAGTYCVWYDPLADGNVAVLIPGGPTYPERGEDGATQTVELAPGEEKAVNFGWAWQFFN